MKRIHIPMSNTPFDTIYNHNMPMRIVSLLACDIDLHRRLYA